MVYARAVRATLVRVAVDQTFGGWNAPYDPATGVFVYVPIPDAGPFHPGMRRAYSSLRTPLSELARAVGCADDPTLRLPAHLARRAMHLDPDFDRLTYGDNGDRRGRGVAALAPGDLIVFFAGLRPVGALGPGSLCYALIGLYTVAEVVRLPDVTRDRWDDNAHTRRRRHHPGDVIVRARPGDSGRLRRALPIGAWRDGAYRLTRPLLAAWGDLTCRDGYLQRSAVPPLLTEPRRFLRWLDRQAPDLVAANHPPVTR